MPLGTYCGVQGPDGRMYVVPPHICASLKAEIEDYFRRGGRTEQIRAYMHDLSADIPRAERLAADLNAGGARTERAMREIGQ